MFKVIFSNSILLLIIFPNVLEAGGGGGSRYVNTGSYDGPKKTNASLYVPLIDYIFQGYNPLALPVCKGKEPLHMMLDMWLYQLFDLNEPKQELTLDVWIDLNWKDCSISWDPDDYQGIKELVLPAHDVWHPDIFAYQGLHGNYEEGLFIFRESKVKVTYEGIIQLGAQLLLRTFCRVNIANFPFDDQICPITFSAWNKDLTVFNMTKKPKHGKDVGHTFESASNGEWLVMGLSASDSFKSFAVGVDECKTEKFSEVSFTLHLKRKPKFIQVYLVFPCMLLLWIASITFVLPVSCSEKVSLVSTILLSMIVFLLVVAGYVPHSSDSVPIIGKFYFTSIALVALAMLMTTIVLNVSYKDKDISMPYILQCFLYSNVARFFCFSVRKAQNDQGYNIIKWQNNDDPLAEICRTMSNESSVQQMNQWEQLGLLLDRVFLFSYVLLCIGNSIYIIKF